MVATLFCICVVHRVCNWWSRCGDATRAEQALSRRDVARVPGVAISAPLLWLCAHSLSVVPLTLFWAMDARLRRRTRVESFFGRLHVVAPLRCATSRVLSLQRPTSLVGLFGISLRRRRRTCDALLCGALSSASLCVGVCCRSALLTAARVLGWRADARRVFCLSLCTQLTRRVARPPQMPKLIGEVKAFLELTKRKDAKCKLCACVRVRMCVCRWCLTHQHRTLQTSR